MAIKIGFASILGFTCFVILAIGNIVEAIPPLRTDFDILFNNIQNNNNNNNVEKEITPLYRLPRNLIPRHYDFETQPILDEGYGVRFTAPGKIRMFVDCVENTGIVTFNAFTLNVTSVNISRTSDGTQIPISNHYQNDTLQTYNIVLNNVQLTNGNEYQIYVEFVAPVPGNRVDGLYLSSYLDSNGERRYLAVTDFEADDCRRMTPLFDEPDLKATWNISIIRKTNYHSLSNARLLSTESVDGLDGWVRDIYEKVGPLPSYLVALAVSDFKNTTASTEFWDGRPVVIWGPPPLIDAGAGAYAPDLSAKILEYLEEYFSYNTTLLKMDKISVPDYNSGAMENWGLNTYRENRLLYLEGTSTIDDYVRMTNTISHEIVHQWFGNLVTMKWWNDLHLNEGFATYYAAIGVEAIKPDHLPLELLIINSIQPAMQADVLKTSHPLSDDSVEEEAEIAGMFSTITYHKGAALLRMMDSFLTNETFVKGLTAYLDKFNFSNAVQNDLFHVLTEQAISDGNDRLPVNVTVEDIMTSWTKQTGFPVVTIGRNATHLTFTQNQYFPTGPNSTVLTKWYIPLSYRLKSEATLFEEWLDDETSTIVVQVDLSDNTKYALVNPSLIGYYRVLYDNVNFQLIINELATNHLAIDTASRSALIDDALNLGFAGYYSTSNLDGPLNLTKYLNQERSLIPWATFLTNMAHPYRMFGRTGAYSNFRNYILGLLEDPLTAIQFEQQLDDTIGGQILLRTRLVEWACNLGHQGCVEFAQAKFQNWTLNATNNQIAPDLRQTVYCAAVANGGDAIWNFVVDQYNVAHVGSPSKHLPDAARIALIRSLGCAKQSYRLAQLLDLALDYQSFLLPEHRITALQAVSGNSGGVYLTFNFIRDNFGTLIRRYGVSIFSNTIATLSNYLNTNSDLTDLTLFIDANNESLAAVLPALEIAKDNVRANINWMSNNYPKFREWLASQ